MTQTATKEHCRGHFHIHRDVAERAMKITWCRALVFSSFSIQEFRHEDPGRPLCSHLQDEGEHLAFEHRGLSQDGGHATSPLSVPTSYPPHQTPQRSQSAAVRCHPPPLHVLWSPGRGRNVSDREELRIPHWRRRQGGRWSSQGQSTAC